MLINILFRDGRTELRHIEIGQSLVGVRITSMVIDSSGEMWKLATDSKAQAWLKSCAHRIWPSETNKEFMK